MPRITFITPAGEARTVEAPVGRSLMQAAVTSNVPGVVGECGGGCSCATCQVHVEAPWSDRIPPPGSTENALLDYVAGADDTSRLSCQIRITAELDGLVVRVADEQGI